jgi:hypothetical protein
MRTARTTTIGLLCLLGAAAAAAQDVAAEQQKLLAKRAAEADAYRKLAEVVYGMQINSRTYVQVPAEVTVAKVVETLRTAHDRYYKGDTIKTSDFESITKRIEKKVIKVVGKGAPRPDLPPDLPEGAAELLGAPPEGLTPPIPDLWKKIGPQARFSAERAAYMDAARRLAERIKGLRLTSRTQVRDFVAESDTITTDLDTFLVGAAEKGGPNAYYLHSDELIAECTLVVPTEQVITAIKELHSRHYRGDDVKCSDIENVVRTVVRRDFEATGMGIPNPKFIQKFAQTSGLAEAQMPDWAMRGLEVEGQGTDPEMATPQGKLRAARAAEMDARRKLVEQIGGLRLQGETTVRDFVAKSDDLMGLVDAVVVDAIVTNTRFTDNSATVTIALPGARVWGVLNDELRRPPR